MPRHGHVVKAMISADICGRAADQWGYKHCSDAYLAGSLAITGEEFLGVATRLVATALEMPRDLPPSK
jgi:hypothetical protein